jgi:pyridoxamine 5'-phosphate oxidase
MDKPIGGSKREYSRQGLSESGVAADPLKQFDVWFDAAVRENIVEPNAMSLATTDEQGRPSVRVVLLKGFDDRGFVFYTDYESRKGQSLAMNPYAALCFWWPELERQVRIEGKVDKTTAAEADAYFALRPRESQIGACLSHQSHTIPNREAIERARERIIAEFAARDVTRPRRWGGYRLEPDRYEFWQGRAHRLHDRLEYVRCETGEWQMRRLSP